MGLGLGWLTKLVWDMSEQPCLPDDFTMRASFLGRWGRRNSFLAEDLLDLLDLFIRKTKGFLSATRA
ncbi:hypothetical protein TNCV_1810811 [Trichonephila clavipes]|nr:hypothetical protein TNCV_1810811 [Trichonephila clavipes]